MVQDFIFHSTPKSELKSLIQEAVKTELAQFQTPQKETSNKLYTRKEVADILDISLVTLHTWTKEGIITAYRIGNQIRYKPSDVEKSLREVQVKRIKR